MVIKVLKVPLIETDSRRKINYGDSTIEDIEKYTYLDVDLYNTINYNIDVVLICTHPHKTGTSSLLLMRFFNKPFLEYLTADQKKQMFSELMNMLDPAKHKIERFRRGGAQGTINYTSLLFEFLKVNNSTPRKSGGVLWLREKNNLSIRAIYRNTNHGEVKGFSYSNPQFGGQILFDTNLLGQYRGCFQIFSSLKPLCASILKLLTLDRYVAPIAIKRELSKMSYLQNYLEKQQIPMNDRMKVFYEQYNTRFNKYTLVVHPVGRHHDVFAGGIPSIENRFCISVDIQSLDKNDTIFKPIQFSNFYGRGGDGVDKFVFAVLDWSGDKDKEVS